MNDLTLLEKKPLKKIRDQVILTLQHGYAHDLIDEDEYEKRINEATNSDNKNALISLVLDLPFVEEDKEPKISSSSYSGDLIINNGPVKNHTTLLTLLSGIEKKGMWKPPKNINVLTLLGGTNIDFSKAAFNPGTTRIKITCIMGGVEITVPRGINVEVGGIPIMGGIDNKTDDTYSPDVPILKIKAVVIMGGVEIKHPEKNKKS